MDRRAFLANTVRVLSVPLAAEAQQAGKVWRLDTLNRGASETYDARRDPVVLVRDLGHVEGRNLEVERRYADGRVERLQALAAEGHDHQREAQRTLPRGAAESGITPLVPGLPACIAGPGEQRELFAAELGAAFRSLR